MTSTVQEKETRETLLKNAKKEVKQIMELAVTLKFIHEDNSCITSLCAAIDSCLLHGLKRNSSGFFKPATSYLLLQKISKMFEPAKVVLQMCDDYEKAYCNGNGIRGQNQKSEFAYQRKQSSNGEQNFIVSNNFSTTFYKGSVCYKFLWIRLALINKLLAKIMDYIVSNSNKFYQPFALIADPVDGLIFNSLLAAPCTLEYTRMKTCDYLWSDQNADELIQRQRMQNAFSSLQPQKNQEQLINESSSAMSHSFKPYNSSNGIDIKSNTRTHNIISPKFKLGLRSSLIAKRKANINIIEEINTNNNNFQKLNSPLNSTKKKFNFRSPETPETSRKYTVLERNVSNESNSIAKFSTPLSFNSNHHKLSESINSSESPPYFNLKKVVNNAKDYVESLHQNTKSQLIYGKNNIIVNQKDLELPGYLSLHLNVNGMVLKWTPNQMMSKNSSSSTDGSPQLIKSRSCFWDFSMHIDINSIVYLHCHQQEGDDRVSIVLIAHDGIQYPPILFPRGSQFLAFLTCFENGLNPNGHLDPPLQTAEGKDNYQKILSDEKIDLVFQIISSNTNTTLNDKLRQDKAVFSIFTNETFLRQSSLFGESNTKETKLSSIISSIFLNSKKENNPVNTPTNETALNSPIFQEDSSRKKHITPSSKNTSVISDSSLSSLLLLSKLDSCNKTPLNFNNIDTSTPTSSSSYNYNQFIELKNKPLSVRNSLKVLCETMKKQIVVRAFYGWLLYHRHLKTVGTHLIGLVNSDNDIDEKFSIDYHNTIQKKLTETIIQSPLEQEDNVAYLNTYVTGNSKLDSNAWQKILISIDEKKANINQIRTLFFKIVYLNGIEPELRKKVWPFLLEHYTFDMNCLERDQKDEKIHSSYVLSMNEWLQAEETIKLKEKNKYNNKQNSTIENDSGISINDTNNASTLISPKTDLVPSDKKTPSGIQINKKKSIDKMCPSNNLTILMRNDSATSNEVFSSDEKNNKKTENSFEFYEKSMKRRSFSESDLHENQSELLSLKSIAKSIVDQIVIRSALILELNNKEPKLNRRISTDWLQPSLKNKKPAKKSFLLFKDSLSKSCLSLSKCPENNVNNMTNRNKLLLLPQGSIDSQDVIDCFAINMHRIDKDVTRCDRNYWYFMSTENLNKLKNIIYTYVWENLNIGYIQGMCDLVAPLLVILDDEPLVYSCFKNLMKRMSLNFPHGMAMDQNFSNMRALIQIMDTDLFEHMYHRGDYTHFYFSYRWFLLDFKREFIYDDVFCAWETIWSSKHVCTQHFYLFIALALVETYRDIILDNNMDFTDIIKFFNEMAEKHDFKSILKLARNLVLQLQSIVVNLNLAKSID